MQIRQTTLNPRNPAAAFFKVAKRFWMPRYFHNEQKLLSFLIHPRHLPNRRWRWARIRWLPKPQFPSGKEFFEKYGPEEKRAAVVVHNNYIPTHERKKQRFEQHGFWRVAEERASEAFERRFRCIGQGAAGAGTGELRR